MLNLIFYFLVFIFILAPALTLIHELGHAIIPLCIGLRVFINIGEGAFIHQTIGNLSVKIGFLKPWIGYTDWGAFHNGEVISLILGPVFSFVFGISLVVVGILKRRKEYAPLLFASAGWCIFQFLFTFFPFNYPEFLGYESGMISDGKKILEMMN